MCDLHEFDWQRSPWDGEGILLVEPCCPLLQMPFCQQVFNWAFIVCVILEVMKQAGKSELAACPPSPGPRQRLGHSSEGMGDPKWGCGPLPETLGIFPPG